MFFFFTAECRNIQENHPYLNHVLKRSASDTDQFQSDGATDGEDDGAVNNTPVITSDPTKIEATEGSTVQLPCKVTQGSCKYSHPMFTILYEIELFKLGDNIYQVSLSTNLFLRLGYIKVSF